MPVPRCSTGSSRAITAGSSCYASQTRTPSARRRRTSARCSRTFAGSGSTGTRVRRPEGPHAPYRQSERFELYRSYAQKLVEGGFAYYDYASSEDVAAERKKAQAEGRRPDHAAIASARKDEGHAPSIRFIVPADRTITFHDEVLGDMSTDLGRTPDFVIMRADGSPTYMLAVTADDIEMGITHVIRGNDLVASTPRQLLIREALGVTNVPTFAHLPLLVAPDGKPLSKRWGDVAVSAYRDQGFLPEAMINYLALLGWSFDDRTNIFSVTDLVEKFTLERVGRNPAAFDVDKLEWLNGHYIRAKTPAQLAELLVPLLRCRGDSGRHAGSPPDARSGDASSGRADEAADGGALLWFVFSSPM